jgi:O-antigen ligase
VLVEIDSKSLTREIPVPSGKSRRHAIARRCVFVALACAAAFAVVPKGLAVFAVLLVLSTLLVPERILAGWSRQPPLKTLTWLVLAVVLLGVVSMAFSGQEWRKVDNLSRLLVMPWCAALVYAVGVPRFSLWVGAMGGLLLASAIAVWQVSGGLDRAAGGGNPIVFANVVLMLMALAIYARPAVRRRWTLVLLTTVLTLGVLTIVLSGSRGALPGLAALLLVMLIGGTRQTRWWRIALSLAVPALLLFAMWSLPGLSSQTRLEVVNSDLARYAQGDVDTPIGARLELLALAGRTFAEHPWTGVGIDRFGTIVDQLPACQGRGLGMCVLDHAHNDIAEWSVTMGIPGLLAILAVYLLPLALFVRIIRRSDRRTSRGAAWAGAMVVVVCFLSGLTQSMFAHALIATAYAVFVGALLGIALLESRSKDGALAERPHA